MGLPFWGFFFRVGNESDSESESDVGGSISSKLLCAL